MSQALKSQMASIHLLATPGKALAAVFVAGLLAAACGIPLDTEPRILDASSIPPELMDPTTTTLPPETSAQSRTLRVFFVNEDGVLSSREREFPTPVTLDEPLRSLFAGPTDDETELGLTSALPAETEILGIDLSDDGLLVLNLAEGTLEQIEGELQRLAIAQLVFTATELFGVEWVWVQIENEPRALPTDEGDLETPVGRQHYASLTEGET